MVSNPPVSRRLLSVFACLLVALVPILGTAPPAQAILNGADASDPVGAVQIILKDGTRLCTGTLINPGWVLTAKHCITDSGARPADTYVLLGDLRYRQGERHDVQQFFEHPTSDAALVKLTTRTDRIDMVLPYGYNDPAIGAPATIKGWGATLAHPTNPATTLQASSNIVATLPGGSDTMVLTSTDGSRPQNGDSGGSVTIHGLLCGVHSSSGPLTSTEVKTSALVTWVVATAHVLPGGACDLDTSKKKKSGLKQRIMAIGSTQTVGPYGDKIGYRDFLGAMLGRAGLPSLFVGPDTAGPPPNDHVADVTTGGGIGYRIEDLEEEARCAVYDYAPDIVTIVAGEEDMGVSSDAIRAPDRLDSLISTVQEVSPRTVVLVSSIAPGDPAVDPKVASSITDYNATVKKIVLDRKSAGQHIDYVDTSDLVTNGSLPDESTADGSVLDDLPVVLLPSGFLKEASAFNLSIDNAVNAGWIPDDLSLNKRPCNSTNRKRDLRVMPLGSSTTYGVHSPDPASDGNGYRKTMDDALEQVVETKDPGTGAADAQDPTPRVDEVGSVRVGTMADRDNEGWPGYRIDGIAGKAQCSVPAYQPNLVTLLAGGNDVIQDYQMGTALNRLEGLVTQIQDDSPTATVLVANMQRFSDPATDARGVAFSQSIPGMVDRLAGQGRHVMFVDLGLTPGDVGGDGIHPTVAGYTKVGRAFAEATSSAFDRGWIEPADPQAADVASSPCGLTDDGANTSGGGGGGGTMIDDTRWEDHGVSFKEGFGPGNRYRWGDVNGDKKPEFFVVEPDQSWTFYWNSGRSDKGWNGWAKGVTRPAPPGGAVGNQLRFADIDGDGETDCVRVNLQGTISVSTWDATKPVGQKLCGKPFKKARLAAGPIKADTQIIFADVDGDKHDDYLLVQPRGTTDLWLNRKSGWIKGGQIVAPLPDARIRRWADIDHNGRADMILITANGGARAWLNEGISQNGDGTLKVRLRDIGEILKDTKLPPADIHFVDAGGDGNADLVRTGWTGVTHIWLNRLGLKPAAVTDGPIRDFSQDPRWEDHGVSFEDGLGQGNRYEFGDVNDDGKPELFVIEPDQGWTFYWNSGRTDDDWTGWAKGFSRPAPASSASGSRLKIADMDGDGRADCAFVREGTISVSTWDDTKPVGQKLCGTPYEDKKINDDCCAYSVVLADVDGDERADYLQIGISGQTEIWLNEKKGWKSLGEVVGAQPDGKNQTWRWADLDGDGMADRISVGSGGTAHAWLTRGIVRDTGRQERILASDLGEIADGRRDVPRGDVHFADVGGDGKADYVRIGWTGVTHIWLNRLTF